MTNILLIIYWSGVCINLLAIIKAFSNDEFMELMNINFTLDNKVKVILLFSCLLSWLIPIILKVKSR